MNCLNYIAQRQRVCIVCTARNNPLRYRCGETLLVAPNFGDSKRFRLLICNGVQLVLSPGAPVMLHGAVYDIIGRQMS